MTIRSAHKAAVKTRGGNGETGSVKPKAWHSARDQLVAVAETGKWHSLGDTELEPENNKNGH